MIKYILMCLMNYKIYILFYLTFAYEVAHLLLKSAIRTLCSNARNIYNTYRKHRVQRVKSNYLCNRCCTVSHASLMRARKFFRHGLSLRIWNHMTRWRVCNLGQSKNPSRSLVQLKSVVRDDDDDKYSEQAHQLALRAKTT